MKLPRVYSVKAHRLSQMMLKSSKQESGTIEFLEQNNMGWETVLYHVCRSSSQEGNLSIALDFLGYECISVYYYVYAREHDALAL